MNYSTECTAENWETCRYHGSAAKAEKAFKLGKIADYLFFRAKADETKIVVPSDAAKLIASPPSVPTMPETLAFAGRDYRVLTDSSLSGFLCPSCGAQYTFDEESELLAHNPASCTCGARSRAQEAGIGIQASSLWLLDKDQAEDNYLYHVTTRPAWHEEITKTPKLRIHLGDHEATKYRANDIYNEADVLPKVFYRYKVRLKSETLTTRTQMSEDLEDNWESIPAKQDFVVYLNRWENPGSLSVMTVQDKFEIVGEPEVVPSRNIWG